MRCDADASRASFRRVKAPHLGTTPDRISGIYAIHGADKHVYIGQSRQIYQRWFEHQKALRLGSHSARLLQTHWRHFGPSKFRYQVIERCTDSLLLRLKLEAMWILRYHAAGYTLYNGYLPFTIKTKSQTAIIKQHYFKLAQWYDFKNFIGKKFIMPHGQYRGKIFRVKKYDQSTVLVKLEAPKSKVYCSMSIADVIQCINFKPNG